VNSAGTTGPGSRAAEAGPHAPAGQRAAAWPQQRSQRAALPRCHAARSPQEAKPRPTLRLQAWEDGWEQPPTAPEAAPAHTALANPPVSAATTISFCSTGSCLAPPHHGEVPGRWGTAVLGDPGNSLPASAAQDGTSDTRCCPRPRLLFSSFRLQPVFGETAQLGHRCLSGLVPPASL